MDTILLSILGLLIGIITLVLCYRFRKFGLVLIFATFVVYAIFNNRSPSIEIFSLRFEVAYGTCLILFIIDILDFLKGYYKHSIPIILLINFSLICLLSLFIGVFYDNFGLGKAIGYFYSYFYLFSTGLYTYTFILQTSNLNVFIRYWIGAAIILCIIAVIKWILIPLGYVDITYYSVDASTYLRVLNASQALFLLYAAIFSLLSKTYQWKYPGQQKYSILFFIIILVLQHRTVWVVALFMLVYVTIFYKFYKKSIFIFGFSIFVLTSIIVLTIDQNIFQSIYSSIMHFSTFEWRIASWQAMINQNDYIHTGMVFLGHPFGFGNTRFVNHVLIEVQAHDFYVQALWDVGIIGLVIIIAVYALAMVSKFFPNKSYDKKLINLLILSQLIYFIPYSVDITSGLLLGTIIGLETVSKK
jgi:hypothetical protein